MAHHRRREPRLPPLPAERPGDWRAAVRSFLQRATTFGTAVMWPSDWTTLRDEPRCARCGTTKVEDGTVSHQGIPSCEGCKRIIVEIAL
jgi:hypothetical protein